MTRLLASEGDVGAAATAIGRRARGYLKQASYHEAAHAVLLAEFGWTICRVSIRPDDEREGGCWAWAREGDGFAVAVEDAIATLAGDLALLSMAADDPVAYGIEPAGKLSDAELEATLTSPLREAVTGYVARSDLRRAQAAIGSCCRTEAEREALMTYCRERAKSLLSTEAIRREVEAAAEALLDREELKGVELAEVMAGA